MGTILHADKTEEQKTAEVSTNIAGRSLSSRPIRTGVDAFSAGTDTFFGRDAFGSAPAVTASAPHGRGAGRSAELVQGDVRQVRGRRGLCPGAGSI